MSDSADTIEPGAYYHVRSPITVRAAQLTEDADWEMIAQWCGGELVNHEIGGSGEYETELIIPTTDPVTGYPMHYGNGLSAYTGDWVVRGCTGVFSVRLPDEFNNLYELAEEC